MSGQGEMFGLFEVAPGGGVEALDSGRCGCGYSLRAPGVGYWTPTGWECKQCGELHTRHHPEQPATPSGVAMAAYQEHARSCEACTPGQPDDGCDEGHALARLYDRVADAEVNA